MSDLTKLQPTPQGIRSVTLLSISVCLGAFVFSYNTVCLTQLAQLLKLKNNLTKQQFVYQLSVATSAFNLGALISPFIYRKYVSIFGQLEGLLMIDLIGICAILLQMVQLQLYILISARFVLGFVIGISTAIIPVYINSISPPSLVGKLGSFNQLMQTIGIVAAYIGGLIIEDNNKNDQVRWRFYLGFFPIIFFVLRIISLQLVFKFETLQRHIQNNQIQDINRYCLMTYGNNSQQIVNSVIQLKSFKKISQQNQSTFKRRFIVALVVVASNQFSGTNSILYYAKQLFNKVTDNDLHLTQLLIILLSVVQLLAVIVSTQIIDKIGRKVMILRGQAFVSVILILISIFDIIFKQLLGPIASILIIILIFLHLIDMNLTLGPCCIVYCAEIVQDITWMIITLKVLSLAIALTSEYMIQYLGLGYMFLIFFALTFTSHIFLRNNMQETKAKSTTQIYSTFGKDKAMDQTEMKQKQPDTIHEQQKQYLSDFS